MRTKALVTVCIVVSLIISCKHAFNIESRARSQIQVSVSDYMEEYFNGIQSIEIKNIETIYVNDSICLLQARVTFDSKEYNDVQIDIRYTYLLDVFQSYITDKPVFCEEVKPVRLLSKEMIRQCRRDVKISGESVYESLIGNVYPIQHPVDISKD